MFKKVLIANRGEIALRIHRACKEMGIQTVAIHSTADEKAMHVRLADEAVCIGPPSPAESYLNKAAILTAANITGADAIHPGVGFLSENAEFAEMVEEHGHTWIGPSPAHLRMMGDKIEAKEAAKRLGIPIVPGSDGGVDTVEDALSNAKEIGFPLIIKAASGGGGRGMMVANNIDEVAEAYNICRTEAKVAFGDDAVYMERYLGEPRHIEVQLIGDGQGNCVHLWERDCSVQRRHQKVIEEAPSPALDQAAREKIGKTVTDAMKEMCYASAGTIEFLYERGEFFFIEMNTRLQVEHPISEMICGIDLVREQIRVAAGEKLSFKQEDIKLNGHSMECRVTAEHPETFMPSPGKITDYHAPGGLGVRVDSHLYSGYSIPPYYDSLVSKLIVHADTREECLIRMDRALGEYVIGGIHTTIPLHQRLIHEEAFASGDYDIHWLEKLMGLK